jgi:hypothetical protein
VALPKPRNAWLPILFVVFALTIVAGTVLSANGGRNLLEVARILKIPLPQREIAHAPDTSSPPDKASAKAWPWLRSISGTIPRQPTPSPSEMCDALSSAGQEPPSFTRTGERGWECSVLLSDRPDDPLAGSLFLQARGEEKEGFSMLRVKFNLPDGELSDSSVRRAVDFIRVVAALPDDAALDADLMSRLSELEDFYFIAGYYGFSFRRELDDDSRYNLIAFNRLPARAEFPASWPTPDRLPATDLPPRITKGPRIAVLTSASD